LATNEREGLVAYSLIYDAIIIGGGPAGLSAALVLGRCLRRIVVCDSGRYRNQRSTALHCFMSRDGIAPSSLLQESRRELERYDTVSMLAAKVTAIHRRGDHFGLVIDDGRALRARTLLVATGVVDELPRIEGLEPLFGHSVHVCPYCDGWEHRNAPIAVYGRGEKGAGLALLVRQWTDDVVLCTHGEALPEAQHRRLKERGISVREDPMRKLDGKDGRLRDFEFHYGKKLARRALFFNTGQHPRSPLLEQLGCEFGEDGGVRCSDTGETSIPGVFVAGDVSRDVQLAIIAAAEGARAALAINKLLLKAVGD
jgi:thioredoxin reductase